MSTTACCSPQIIPTHTPWPQRAWRRVADRLSDLRAQWRRQSRERAERLLLESLSDSTLRDIGLAERVPVRPWTLGVLDQERGRWS